MELDVALPWHIITNIRSWFMSSIDRDCAKYGGTTKRNFGIPSIILDIWTTTKIDGDTLKIKKKGVNQNGGHILT